MTARLGQLTLIITIIAVGYFMFSAVQGSVKTGVTFTNTGSSLEDGLTAHWTFDGPNMVSNVADVSGNGLNLNLTNFTSTTTVSGKVGQALSFDGVDDFAEESSVLLTNVITASDGTISLWMKPTGAPKSNATGYELPSFFGDRWGYMGIIRGVIGSNDRIWAYNYDSDPGDYIGVTYDVDEWVHITWVHTGGNLYIYKNGVLEDSVVSGNTGGVNGKVYLGSSYNGATNRYAEGYIDDVRTYNRALSAEEITQLYKMGEGSKVGKTPTTPAGLETGLTAHWTFDGPDMINAITDVSGNGHDVFLTSGMATNTSPGKVGQALSFDASGYIDTASDFSNFITTDEGTISLWLKPSQAAPDVTSQSSMWGGRQAIGGYATFGLFGIAQANNTGLGEDKIWAWNWGTSLKAVGVTYNVGEWIHITWVHSGGTLYVYKNGELVDSVASDSTGAAGNFLIGNNWFSLGGTSRRWKGDMDDIYTYNRALSADEIKQIYNLGGNKVGKTVTPTGQDSGLVGHWTFDGPDMDWGSASAEVQDASGNGNDGDATSMTTNSVVPLGAIGQALQFDGSGDYIDIGTSADFKPTGSLAVSFWYKGLKGSAEHFISHSPQSLTNYWYVSEDQSMFCGSTSCSTSVVNTFTLPDDNEWHHVVVSLNETPSPDELSVYIDGVLDDTVTDNRDGGSNWGSNTRIGTGFWGGSGDRQGPMDDVRIYNRALTADEALQLYNMGR